MFVESVEYKWGKEFIDTLKTTYTGENVWRCKKDIKVSHGYITAGTLVTVIFLKGFTTDKALCFRVRVIEKQFEIYEGRKIEVNAYEELSDMFEPVAENDSDLQRYLSSCEQIAGEYKKKRDKADRISVVLFVSVILAVALSLFIFIKCFNEPSHRDIAAFVIIAVIIAAIPTYFISQKSLDDLCRLDTAEREEKDTAFENVLSHMI